MRSIEAMLRSEVPDERFEGLQEAEQELWRRGVVLCDLSRAHNRHLCLRAVLAEERGVDEVAPPPPPPPRTKWTRRVPHPVLSGHAASLTPY